MKLSNIEKILLNGAIKNQSPLFKPTIIAIKIMFLVGIIVSVKSYFKYHNEGFVWQAMICVFALFTLIMVETYQSIIRKIHKTD